MNVTQLNLRTYIRNVISESIGNLDEMQKGKQFGLYLDMALDNIKPNLPEGILDDVNVMREIKKQLKTKLDKIFLKNFDYNNFQIIKLGDFIIKTNKGNYTITFKKAGEEDKGYSYPYIFVYHDTAELFKFASRFFDSDQILIAAAKEYIKNRGYKLDKKTMEKGKVEINSDYDQDNIIDLIDYSKIKRPEVPKRDISPILKNKYAVKEPFVHKLYGKGKIVKTKKFGKDEEGNLLYNITVSFDGKEKTFRIKSLGDQDR